MNYYLYGGISLVIMMVIGLTYAKGYSDASENCYIGKLEGVNKANEKLRTIRNNRPSLDDRVKRLQNGSF